MTDDCELNIYLISCRNRNCCGGYFVKDYVNVSKHDYHEDSSHPCEQPVWILSSKPNEKTASNWAFLLRVDLLLLPFYRREFKSNFSERDIHILAQQRWKYKIPLLLHCKLQGWLMYFSLVRTIPHVFFSVVAKLLIIHL